MHFPRNCFAISLLSLCCLAAGEEKPAAKSAAKKAAMPDASYKTLALSAAPRAIAKEAGVVRPGEDGSMKTLRESRNGFTCMVALGSPMCADENSMAFFGAWMKHENPPDKLGITYMLGGDKGASNTDPASMNKGADNHWIVTGPHIMIVGPAAKSLGLTDAADPDPNKPYLMWANTPYAHAMIPVAAAPAMAAKSEKSEATGEMKEQMKCSK